MSLMDIHVPSKKSLLSVVTAVFVAFLPFVTLFLALASVVAHAPITKTANKIDRNFFIIFSIFVVKK